MRRGLRALLLPPPAGRLPVRWPAGAPARLAPAARALWPLLRQARRRPAGALPRRGWAPERGARAARSADLEFLGKQADAGAIARLEAVAATPFKRLSYTEAVEILEEVVRSKKKKFEFPVRPPESPCAAAAPALAARAPRGRAPGRDRGMPRARR